MADRFGYGEIGLDIHPCKGCEDYEPPDGCKTRGGCAKSMTNADRIRAMSDEELADTLKDIGMQCPDGHFVGDYDCFDGSGCATCWLDWLKSSVEVEE